MNRDICPNIRSSYQLAIEVLTHLPEVKSSIVNPRKFMFFLLYYFFRLFIISSLLILTKHGLSGVLSTQKQRLILSPELVSYWSDCWLIIAYLS